jgi:putative sigma-54 modulation protein
MRIVITGRHLGVTEPMKAYAHEKAGKLGKIHDRLTSIEVTMDVAPHGGHVAEIVADASRARLVGKAEHPDMYAAIDLAEDKVVRQLVRHKQRLADHHRGETSMSGIASASEDAYRLTAPGARPLSIDAPSDDASDDESSGGARPASGSGAGGER